MPGRKTFEAAMILAMAGLYFFSFFQRVAIPGAIFNDIQTEFSISAEEVTRLSAIYLFVYAVMQPFAGLLADRFGGVRVVVVSEPTVSSDFSKANTPLTSTKPATPNAAVPLS